MKRNTITCADAIEYMATLPDSSVDMVLCDPPYGTTMCKWDSVIPLDKFWEALTRVAKPHAAMLIFSAQPFTSELIVSNREMFRYEIIGKKARVTGFLNISTRPLKTHENILVFFEEQGTYNPQMKIGKAHKVNAKSEHHRGSDNYGDFISTGARITTQWFPTSIIEMSGADGVSVTYAHRPNKQKNHPTQKAVSVCDYLIKTYSQPGELILDPTCGSGTTFMAARKCDRDYIGCDISPEYVDMARKRLANSDPYQATETEAGEVQLSLFGVVNG